MPLRLVTGRPNAGKTGILYAVAARSSSVAVPTILLPSAPDVARARRDLATGQGLVMLRVEQIDRYLAGLWEIHGDGRQIVTPIQRSALLRAAIAESGIHNLTSSAETRGFGMMLERLASHLSSSPRTAGRGIAGKIADSLVLYYESLVTHGLVELSEATGVLSDRAADINFEGPVIANRFDDLTAAQERFLVAAADSGAEVWLALTGGTGDTATQATDELVERIRQRAASVQVADECPDTSGELSDLARGLFAPKARTSARGDVLLSVAYGEEAEAERIVAEVVTSMQDGIEPEQIAVIYRDTRRHFSALRRALSDAGVPADFDVRIKFGETGLGRAVLTLLEFAATGRRTHLVAFLGSGYAGLAAADVDRLDAMWRRQGPTEDFKSLIDGLERIDATTRRMVRAAVGLAHAGVNAENAGYWKELAGVLLAHGYGRTAAGLEADATIDAAAHRRLCEAIDDLSELDALKCDPLGLREVLVVAQVAVPLQERPGHIQVMDVERVRGRRFACVVIGGLTSGEFPRKQADGVFASGRLVDELTALGVDVPRDGGIAEERLWFYLAVTRASKRLVLSRQEADSDGRPLRGSSLLEELLEMYRPNGSEEREIPSSKILAFADLGVHPAAPDLVRRALRTVAMSGVGRDIEPIGRAASRAEAPSDVISDALVLEHLAGRDTFSVTELETYLQCPHSWYYGRFVRPEALEEDSDPLVRGNLAHKALWSFYDGIGAALGVERVTPENLEECLLHADRVTDEILAQGLGKGRLRDTLMAMEVRRLVSDLVTRDARYLPGYTPYLLEWSFGRGQDPAVKFDGFALRGQVDRIDRAQDRFVVIDYKTGKVKPQARFEADGVLQAPLY
ncbi:MAG: PD-(D/E)XK nuclease family protein, partial [Actinobacteria bacterium]|nr:PD-(D/E)XK nuclease family protein [Actinomycetota bacterium]MCG2808511.1 PD-(D/E)XK nuclease family protein [Coriobacteriia bacterium]